MLKLLILAFASVVTLSTVCSATEVLSPQSPLSPFQEFKSFSDSEMESDSELFSVREDSENPKKKRKFDVSLVLSSGPIGEGINLASLFRLSQDVLKIIYKNQPSIANPSREEEWPEEVLEDDWILDEVEEERDKEHNNTVTQLKESAPVSLNTDGQKDGKAFDILNEIIDPVHDTKVLNQQQHKDQSITPPDKIGNTPVQPATLAKSLTPALFINTQLSLDTVLPHPNEEKKETLLDHPLTGNFFKQVKSLAPTFPFDKAKERTDYLRMALQQAYHHKQDPLYKDFWQQDLKPQNKTKVITAWHTFIEPNPVVAKKKNARLPLPMKILEAFNAVQDSISARDEDFIKMVAHVPATLIANGGSFGINFNRPATKDEVLIILKSLQGYVSYLSPEEDIVCVLAAKFYQATYPQKLGEKEESIFQRHRENTYLLAARLALLEEYTQDQDSCLEKIIAPLNGGMQKNTAKQRLDSFDALIS